MEFHKLTDTLTVSPQILADDIPAIHAAGFRSLICNRPDGEGADQPLFHEIEDAAAAAGIVTRYQPVKSGMLADSDAAEFARLLEELPKPVFAYCRTGTRSASLWALSQAGKQPLPDILKTAGDAGYNMSGIVRRIANNGKTPTGQADISHEIP